MRQPRTVLRVVLVLSTLLGLTACATTSARCRDDRCTVAVKTTATASVEILDHQLTFDDLVDGSVTVVYAGAPYRVGVGQTAVVGPLSVTVLSATPGRAKLSVSVESTVADPGAPDR
ncbi:MULTISPECIES: hypothetical protein [unclassified Solwaraspora]|uniref:hypothetical protein n=1 Tax=unclassified Solwaraspora TaxID=2627926 RepID=UPI00259B3FC4|nr:hypothetical protein [Solwaraspora sp. WMMA2056]WJK38870.1 hypothetical protein O7608_20500 [Solwaraspora sp. WMMA2056]